MGGAMQVGQGRDPVPARTVTLVITVAAAVIAVVLFGAILLDRIAGLRDDVANLSSQVASSVANAGAAVPATSMPLIDLPIPNHDAEELAVVGVAQRLLGATAPVADWQASVDDPAGLDPAIHWLFTNQCRASAVLTFSSVTFQAPDRAHLVFAFTGPSVPGPGSDLPMTGDAVKAGGSWKLTAATITNLWSLGKDYCHVPGESTTTGPSPSTTR